MKTIVLSALSVLAVFALAAGSAQPREFKGFVTDDMCGAEHMMEGMNDKECADECVGMGAAYALYVPDDEKMYKADDPEKLKALAGEDVVVKGELQADGETITIASVTKQSE